jgi:hypothetical protein
LGHENLLEEINVDFVEKTALDETETMAATWYRFKTDLPPQYSFALSAQIMLQGLAVGSLIVLTDPVLRTLPQ